ncbi:hypothetical protein [Enterovibrio norvegicus]|uniref:Uncharacterized protein n=1 Tax=Enterovibrio norvegicus DSM 15893 TaxID=1121869 RepID=A0A1I5T6K7_9GAMM|nr:hypothetical protein [Enterovibrio norvegicus]SFP78287.1 hypothetical protein SAMN03084138_03101 [Enterovibrio norvegicus DSM 15893]
MYFLLSGEGKGDIGRCGNGALSCDRDNFDEGPMALIVDQLVDIFQGYEMSHLDVRRVSYVSEAELAEKKIPAARKAMSLRGKKKPQETKYYFENARSLSELAKNKSEEVGDTVIAVLFRDSDGTASSGRGDWQNKRDSMLEGFRAQNFEFGVAMIPKPKSEAWLLCALKPPHYQNCDNLEERSGNDDSPNSLKGELRNVLNNEAGTFEIKQLINDRSIDVNRIVMPSFEAFKDSLRSAMENANTLAR